MTSFEVLNVNLCGDLRSTSGSDPGMTAVISTPARPWGSVPTFDRTERIVDVDEKQ